MWHAGVGPFYVISIFILTIGAIYIGRFNCFLIGVLPIMKLPLLIVGIIFIVLGIILWVQAAIISQINKKVDENKLITTGVYAWVRNPIYSAFTIIFTGILCLQNNLLLLVVPFIYWLFLSRIVRKEEVFLKKKFGEEYALYKSKVNRCIPWFPK